MKRKWSLLLALLILLPLPAGCAQTESVYTKYSTSFFGAFDTIVTIIGYAKSQDVFDGAAAEAQKRFERYHQVFDAYNAYDGVNNLYKLNREAANAPVPVEPELMALLLYCKEMQPQMLGKVNIAMGSVLSIWHAYREKGESDPANAALPPMELLEEAARHVDFDAVLLDPDAGTVFFEDPDLLIDLGSIAKGYATEQVAQWMLTSEMPSFILNAGGNIRTGNHPEDGRLRWGVSIQNPDAIAFGGPSENDLDTMYVAGLSVVTSGDYLRYYTVEGTRYHHIISPGTLMPSDYMRAITVVCEDSGRADLLSTMLFLMPYEEGLQYVEANEGIEAYWVLSDNSIHYSSGMSKLLKSTGALSSDPM